MFLHARIGRLRNCSGDLRTLCVMDLELFSIVLRLTRSFPYQYAFGVLHSDRVGATSANRYVLHTDNSMTCVWYIQHDNARAES